MLDLLPPSSKRILETHDICTDQFLSQEIAVEHQKGSPPNPLNSARREYLFRVETSLFNLYDATLMVQPEELRTVQAVKVRNAHYIPRMCPTEPASGSRHRVQHAYDLLFVGSDHVPNREGINRFLKQVYEPFLSKHKVRMAIVGRVCDHVRFHFSHVDLLGVVNGSAHALKDVYYDSKLVVVPILEGTGISIKTLEALAMGRAVVSTPVGARGLQIPAGRWLVWTCSSAGSHGRQDFGAAELRPVTATHWKNKPLITWRRIIAGQHSLPPWIE